jgi:hypothetical protein
MIAVRPEPVATALVGYRAWTIKGGALQPVSNTYLPIDSWVTGTAEAVCLRTGCYSPEDWKHGPDETPHPPCNCGLWAHATLDHDRMEPSAPDLVKGLVVAWGRVVVHEHGFRARHARVVAFLDEGRTFISALGERYGVGALGERYGVPVLPERELVAYAGWWS